MPRRVENPKPQTLLTRAHRERVKLGIRVGSGNKVTPVVQRMVERMKRLRRMA